MTYPLFEFAYVLMPNSLEWLAELADDEDWEYHFTQSEYCKPVLYSYLQYTFDRVQQEGKITYANENKLACFNTGLITSNQEQIFALFEPNSDAEAPQKYFLRQFCKESDRLLIPFGVLPRMAHYFDDPAELLYDARLELRKNVDHIIDDNKERFPEPFRSMPDNYSLRITLNGAIDDTIKRVQRNYKTAIPQFYQGRIQLLLPLCLKDPTRADLALVVYRQNTVYLASTVLTLDMAYNNARLLTRPDHEWLVP